MKILYVEDDRNDAELARNEFARHSPAIAVEIAASLAEATARLAADNSFELALIDLRLPDGNGLELLAQIREKNLPLAVVILTGLGDEETAVAALKAGADDYLSKREGYLASLPKTLEQALARFQAETVRRSHQLRVLYVERHQLDADLARRHLSRHAPHIRLEVVFSASEALQCMPDSPTRDYPFDVLLLDYQLPGLNALELIKTLRSDRQLDLPMILITGQGDEEVAAQALRLGASDYLVKHSGYLFELPAALENAYHQVQLAREQAALRESEARYKSLFENNHAVMLIINPATAAIIDANPAASTYYGWSREELKRMRIDQINTLSPAEVATAMQQAHSAKRGHFIFKHRLANGQIRDVEIYSGPIQLANQQLLYTIVHDITERIRAEEALQASESYFRALIANASDIITVLEADGTIRYIGPSVTQIMGYTPQEVTGQIVFRLIHPEDLPLVQTSFGYIIQNEGETRSTVFRVRHRDGTWRILESSGRSLLSEPAVRGIIVNSRDITSRRELEVQFYQSQKMESIGRLAGGIAHDLNNLLVPILGYTDLALYDVPANAPLAEQLRQVKLAGERAADLTRQILAFSRRQVLQVTELDLNQVIIGFKNLMQRLIGETIKLNTSLAASLNPIMADKSQLEQILLNLVINARDAMPGGGALSLETANATLDRAYVNKHPDVEPGDYVMLAVSDTGHGMDAEVKSRIFEPFFTTKEPGKGTGLGLATVYGITKQHNGHIWVYSEPGQGTSFKVYLPAASHKQRPVVAKPHPNRIPHGDETILLVEDEDAVRQLVSETLESRGYRLLQARDPVIALTIANEYRGDIHLLLTDVVLPHMNGPELFNQIVELYPDIKVLYMSGYTDDVMVRHGVLQAGIHFLQKPFSVNLLAQKVKQVLSYRVTPTGK
ncbi:MAG: Sensor histidine kinase RcsC [Anaerolineae bacterium]|nr:Sensor histidine kinase RcsC [Anaerolineae bacterium]